jgi:hypothetical protein
MFLLGFLALLAVGYFNPANLRNDPDSYGFVALVLLGPSWLVASLVALRHQRLAARILLVTAPPITFCVTLILAYSELSLAPCILCTVLFLSPFYLPLLARAVNRALLIFLASGLIVAASLVLTPLRRTAVLLLSRLAPASLVLLTVAWFWFTAYKLNWPALLPPRSSQSVRGHLAKISIGLTALTLAYIVGLSTASLLLPSFDRGCNYFSLFDQPRGPRHAAFIFHVIYLHNKFARHPGAESALGVAEHNFWRAPHWPWRVVLVRGAFFEPGETYLFDGEHSQGLATRFLPFEVAHPCGWTRQAGDASLELHLLNHPPSKPSIITGQVYRSTELTHAVWPTRSPYVGAEVIVTSSAGSVTATTDSQGIYAVAGLNPADYTVSVALPNTEYTPPSNVSRAVLESSIVEATFPVTSDGSLEGQVTNSAGSPVQVWLSLRTSDGSGIRFERSSRFAIKTFLRTDSRGLFHFEHIPEGDYKIAINFDASDKNRLYASSLSAPIHLAPAQRLSHLSLHAIKAAKPPS